MNKIFFLLLALLGIYFHAFPQNHTENFQISLPEQKVENSLYKTIKLVDSRDDKENMGIVQLGAFNKKAFVIPKISFATQLTDLVNSLTDTTAKDGTLFFQLRQLRFAEITSSMSERGYCYLKAELYSNNNNYFQRISSVDTVIAEKSMDVTRALLRHAGNAITNFIAVNLLKAATDTNYYTSRDIINIDSIEKLKIPLYNVSTYLDGLYATYTSLKNQMADKQITAKLKDGKLTSVKTINKKGKPETVNIITIYAVVYNGQPYIATRYGYYPLHRENNDFFFTGKDKINTSAAQAITAGFFFGIAGALIASDESATFLMKIDHTNGGFNRIREIK